MNLMSENCLDSLLCDHVITLLDQGPLAALRILRRVAHNDRLERHGEARARRVAAAAAATGDIVIADEDFCQVNLKEHHLRTARLATNKSGLGVVIAH